MAFQSSPRRRCYPVPRPCSVPALGGGAFQGEPSLLLNCETRQFRPCYHLCFCPFTRNRGERAIWASLFPALPGTQDSPSVGAWLVLACPCHSGGPMTHVGTAQSSASWMSVLLGAEVAVIKHTSLYFESGDSTAENIGNLISFTKVGLQIRCFPVMVWLNSCRDTALLDLSSGDPGPWP